MLSAVARAACSTRLRRRSTRAQEAAAQRACSAASLLTRTRKCDAAQAAADASRALYRRTRTANANALAARDAALRVRQAVDVLVGTCNSPRARSRAIELQAAAAALLYGHEKAARNWRIASACTRAARRATDGVAPDEKTRDSRAESCAGVVEEMYTAVCAGVRASDTGAAASSGTGGAWRRIRAGVAILRNVERVPRTDCAIVAAMAARSAAAQHLDGVQKMHDGARFLVDATRITGGRAVSTPLLDHFRELRGHTAALCDRASKDVKLWDMAVE
eukprot:IDg1915t1